MKLAINNNELIKNANKNNSFASSQPSTTGEQKTKPTQNSVRELRGLGLSPDLVR